MTQMNSKGQIRYFGRDITNIVKYSKPSTFISTKFDQKSTRGLSVGQKIEHDNVTVIPKLMVNLQIAPDYIKDIFKYTLAKQDQEYLELKKQTKYSITFAQRSKIISQMIENHLRLRLFPQTLYIGIFILDKSLTGGLTIKRGQLESVGTVALFIAAKYQETYRIPKLNDLMIKTGISMSERQILETQGKIMQILNFNLTIQSSFNFLQAINKLTGADQKNLHFAQFFIELSFFYQKMNQYKQSQIGCAAYYLVSKIQKNQNPWPESLKQLTKYSQQDLINCTKALLGSYDDHLLCRSISPIRKKFSKIDFNEIPSIKFDRKIILDL